MRDVNEEVSGVGVDQPTLRRRELGRLLRQLREQAGLTAEDAGRRVDLSGPTMSRIERGTTRVRPLVVNALLLLYGAPEEMHALASSLTSQAQQRGWWQQFGALPAGLGGYLALEADATLLRSYDTHLIHGLLQTPEYARAQALIARPQASRTEIDRFVTVRTTRQARLTHATHPLRLTVLIEQVALERPIGGRSVMRDQLTALLRTMDDVPTVTIGVLPTAVGAHEGLDGPFSILSFGPLDEDTDYPDVGHIDTRAGTLFVENADQVTLLSEAFDHLLARALDRDATYAALRAALDAL